MRPYSLEKWIDPIGIIADIFTGHLHVKRQQSLAYAAMGVLASETLFLHDIGEAMAKARNKNKKHTTKQIDRLLSNKGIDIWDLFAQWVPYVIGASKEIILALDWTSFADDQQWMLSLNIVTAKGMATPLLWKTIEQSQLKHNRARYEDQLLSRLKSILPSDVKVLLLADRGFADQKFFKFLDEELKFNYIIRIKNNTVITHQGTQQKAVDLVVKHHKLVQLKKAAITLTTYPVEQVVIIQDKEMKAPWVLVSNTPLKGREIIDGYAKRWKIEPYFRDLKDGRFGYGLQETHFQSCERRDRLMLIVALSYLLLVLLGEAGEQLGFDKKLKVNTVKTRTHSLFRQGEYYYECFHRFTETEQMALLENFNLLLAQKPFWTDFFECLK